MKDLLYDINDAWGLRRILNEPPNPHWWQIIWRIKRFIRILHYRRAENKWIHDIMKNGNCTRDEAIAKIAEIRFEFYERLKKLITYMNHQFLGTPLE